MRFTREQFDDIGKFYIDDLNINDEDQGFMLQVFNELPNHLQGLAVQWGFSDTVFRDDVFEYLIKALHGMTVTEYYDKKVHERPNLSNQFVLDKLRDNDGE